MCEPAKRPIYIRWLLVWARTKEGRWTCNAFAYIYTHAGEVHDDSELCVACFAYSTAISSASGARAKHPRNESKS
jgi:hypothetical protein